MAHKLYLGDMCSILPTLPKADLLVTDPPYRWNKTTGGRARVDKFASKWQGNITGQNIIKASIPNNTIKFKDWMPIAYSALKNQAHCYIFTNDKNMQDALNAATSAGFRLHNILVWKKNNCTPNRWYMKNAEFILFLYKGKAFPISNLGSQQVLDFKNLSGKQKLHPTEKPVDLLRYLIANSSSNNDIVLDPFMGSGSTGTACYAENRSFMGIEVDENFFSIAKTRLDSYNQKGLNV